MLVLYVPQVLVNVGDGDSDASQVALVSALLNDAVRQWATFNERWPAVRGRRRATTPRRAAQVLRYLDRVFKGLQVQFESLIEAFTDARDRPGEPTGDALEHPLFRHARETAQEVQYSAVAFPPHLKDTV